VPTEAEVSDSVVVPGGASVIEPTGPRRDHRRIDIAGVGLLWPAAVLLLIFFLLPVGLAFYFGLTNLKLIGIGSNSYGFHPSVNLSAALHDPYLRQSIFLTAIFVIVGVIGADIIGLALAASIRGASKFVGGLVGSLALIAFILPEVTVGMTWYAFAAYGGTLSSFLHQPHSDYLISDAMIILVAANVWSVSGFAMLTFSAGLRGVPQDMIEAAQLDGVSPFQRARYLFLPALKPTLVITSLILTLLSIGDFTLVYLLTAGGPGDATMILPMYSYQEAFQFNNLAYGALVGDVTVILAAVVAVVFVRVSKVK
jgi:multiple sugar transport system permease protein